MTTQAHDIDKLLAALSPEQRERAAPLIAALRSVDDTALAELLSKRIKSDESAHWSGSEALAEAERSVNNILALRHTHPALSRSLVEKLLSHVKLFSEHLFRQDGVDRPAEASIGDTNRAAPTAEARDSRLISAIRNYWYLKRLSRTDSPLPRATLTAEVISRGFSPNGENAAATALNRLVEQGHLSRPADGYFSITSKGRAEVDKLRARIERTGGQVPDVP